MTTTPDTPSPPVTRLCRVGPIAIGPGHPLTIIAGPCLLESLELGLQVGQSLKETCARLNLPYIFKASFDKANRTSISSPRGPGLHTGLDWLAQLRESLDVPITTDIHTPEQCDPVAQVVDLLQIPAFLCRQTDLLLAAGQAAATHGKGVNIKKGQFLSPEEMKGPVEKLSQAGCSNTLCTERGTFFGYHRLVNDFLGLGDLMELASAGGPPPVCFDATHSTQLPGAGTQTQGRPERAPLLAKAAVAAGVHAVFIECHPDPSTAQSDAATQQPLASMPNLLEELAAIRNAVDSAGTGSMPS